MSWVDSPTAIQALRAILFDGVTDKICSMKKVFGVLDQVNVVFKTFEYRRVQDFSSPTAPFGLFKNGTAIAPSDIQSDDPATGTIVLQIAYVATLSTRDSITATYNYQWFTDAELDVFMQNASTWLGFSPTYINIPDGLNASALRFAAQEAYLMAAMKYSTRMSETYKLEDAPDETILKSVEAFKEMADSFEDKAKSMRDDFYTRQGQSLSPLFGFSLGRVRDPVPRR